MIHPLLSGGLLLLLTTGIRASTYISLGGNFQQLPSGIIGECRRVYNQPIENCSAKDFQLNGACSQECVASLENLSNVLNTVCPGVIVDSRTLLGLIFQNLLVKAVCNAIESPVQSEEPTVAATTPVNTLEPATTSAEPTQSPTSEAPSSIASTEEPAKSSALGLGPNPTPEPTPTEVEVPQTTTSSKQEEPTSRSKKQEQIDANRNSGGGSPFDNIIPDNEAVHTRRSPIMSLVAALLATIILV